MIKSSFLPILIILGAFIVSPVFAQDAFVNINQDAGQTTDPFCIKNNAGTKLTCFNSDGDLDLNTNNLKGSMGCSDAELLVYALATDTWDCTAAGSGETNTASNVGTGVGIFDAKTGVDFELNSLLGDDGLTITDTVQDITIAFDDFIFSTGNAFQGTFSHDLTADSEWEMPNYAASILSNKTLLATYTIINDGGTYRGISQSGQYAVSNSDLDSVISIIAGGWASDSNILIELGAGEFVCTTCFTITNSNFTFQGQGMGTTWGALDTDSADDAEFIHVGQAQTSTERNIDDEKRGSHTVTTNTASHAGDFAKGDWAIIESDTIIATSDVYLTREYQQVESADAATGIITFKGELFDDHVTNSASPTIRLANLLTENVNIKDLSITGLRDAQTTGTVSSSIKTQFTKNLNIESVDISKVFYAGMHLESGINTKVSNCNVNNVTMGTTLSYGITFRGFNEGGIIQGCTFSEVRYGASVNSGALDQGHGANRNIVFDSNTVYNARNGCFDTHEGAEGVIFSNNLCQGSSYIQDGDGTTVGINMRSSGSIIGNTFKNLGQHGVLAWYDEVNLEEQVDPASKLIISDNYFENIEQDGLNIENVTNAVISNNIFHNIGTQTIEIQSNGFNRPDGQHYYALIEGNVITNSSKASQVIFSQIRTDIIGNSMSNSGFSSGAIELDSDTNCGAGNYHICGVSGSTIQDNSIHYAGHAGIRVDRGNNILIDGNHIYRPANVCVQGSTVVDYDLSNSTISNNYCHSPGYPTGNQRGMYLQDVVGTFVHGNHFLNATHSTDGALAFVTTADDNFIHGNFFSVGSFGIEVAGGTGVCTDNYYDTGNAADSGTAACPTAYPAR